MNCKLVNAVQLKSQMMMIDKNYWESASVGHQVRKLRVCYLYLCMKEHCSDVAIYMDNYYSSYIILWILVHRAKALGNEFFS